ncbi:MAG TPA: hypothetical protein VEA69_18180 [Tepidisphaeraceae bacterium]|nr:hypothetical protein [Tepidisphaeraceae bacterium]
MAGIYRINCAACDYRVTFPDWALLATSADGTTHVCHHPSERSTAERVAGVAWDELCRSGAVHGAVPSFCPACGAVDYFRSPAVRGGPPAAQDDRTCAGQTCRSCGHRGLLRSTNNVQPYGGCAVAGALLTAPVLAGAAWGWPYAVIGVVVFAAYVLWWVHLARRERRRWAGLSCPKCGGRGLRVEAVGIS